MDITQFVYDSIVKQAAKAGSTDSIARRHAEMGRKMFKQSSFIDKTVDKMIERMVKEAAKESKMAKKKSKTPSVIPRKAATKPKRKPQAKKKTTARDNFVSDKVRNREFKSSDGLWSNK